VGLLQKDLHQMMFRPRSPEIPDAQPAVVACADQDVCRLVCEVYFPHRQRMHVGPVACTAPFSHVPCLRRRHGVGTSACSRALLHGSIP